jgi:hypothetical protein
METRQKGLLIGWILVIVLSFGSSFCVAADFAPKKGNYYVKEINSVKFHTYTAPVPTGAVASNVIETQNYLVMVDTLRDRSDNEELKRLVESLRKPLNRIYISDLEEHHWVGLEMFLGMPTYSLETTIKEIKEKGDQVLQELKNKFGEEAIPYNKVVIPENVVKPGEERIDGVLFRFIKASEEYGKEFDGVLFIEFPGQEAFFHEHLAYMGIDSPLPPTSARTEALKKYKGRNYSWVMAGHGIPAVGTEFFLNVKDEEAP